jgi:hypothetical protein
MASQTEVYNRLVSNKGMFLVSDTEVYTAGFYGLVIREDSVISSWEDEDGRNLITYLGLSGKTLTSTDSALMIPGGKYNGSFSLSSGSAWLLGVTGATAYEALTVDTDEVTVDSTEITVDSTVI